MGFSNTRLAFVFCIILLFIGMCVALPYSKLGHQPDRNRAGGCLCNKLYKDVSDRPDVFESTQYPSYCCQPSVGNGYLATVIYGDSIFMNGVFNGKGGDSHRARIPSTANIAVTAKGVKVTGNTYRLDVSQGLFMRIIDSDLCTITQYVYAHQVFARLLVNEITVKRKKPGEIIIRLTNGMGPKSPDINFSNDPDGKHGEKVMHGNTMVPETSTSGTIPVYVHWTYLPSTTTISSNTTSATWTFITAIATTDKKATDMYATGLSHAMDGTLHTMHVNAWKDKWRKGCIDIDNNLPLAKAIYGSMYYIMSSLPPLNYTADYFQFFGLSPGGLAHGAQNADYQGHVFWDQATWMYPPILMFHPELAKAMLSCRTFHLDAAKTLAKQAGLKGAKFPWEMAYSGFDVCPAEGPSKYEIHVNGDIAFAVQQYIAATWDSKFLQKEKGYELITALADFWATRSQFDKTKKAYVIKGRREKIDVQEMSVVCSQCRVYVLSCTGFDVCPEKIYTKNEIHVNGDIAYATQQYVAATWDIDFLLNERGYEMITGLADFWATRSEFDEAKNAYVIKGVMPPDEYHEQTDDSVYTNTIAQMSLNLPQYAGQFINATVPSNWTHIADNMYILFDEKNQYHPEYEGYTLGTVVKQADVILLGFPLMVNMSQQVRRNDLLYYESYNGRDVTDPNGPAMTWGMFAVGWIELGNMTKADQLFQKSFANIQQPFKGKKEQIHHKPRGHGIVWTETATGEGAINFATGMGGFLQSVLFGYGGLRLHKDRIDFNFNLPPKSEHFNVTGIDYLGSSFDFKADSRNVAITLTSQAEGAPPLDLISEGTTKALVVGKTTSVPSRMAASIKPHTAFKFKK